MFIFPFHGNGNVFRGDDFGCQTSAPFVAGDDFPCSCPNAFPRRSDPFESIFAKKWPLWMERIQNCGFHDLFSKVRGKSLSLQKKKPWIWASLFSVLIESQASAATGVSEMDFGNIGWIMASYLLNGWTLNFLEGWTSYWKWTGNKSLNFFSRVNSAAKASFLLGFFVAQLRYSEAKTSRSASKSSTKTGVLNTMLQQTHGAAVLYAITAAGFMEVLPLPHERPMTSAELMKRNDGLVVDVKLLQQLCLWL